MSSRRGPQLPGKRRRSTARIALGFAYREGGLGRVGEIVAIGHLERLGWARSRPESPRPRAAGPGSDHFRMAAMSDQQSGPAALVVAARRAMHLHTSGQVASASVSLRRSPRGDPFRHAVRREHHERLIRHLVELFDEDRALGPQLVDHVTVVHDLVAHVDRRRRTWRAPARRSRWRARRPRRTRADGPTGCAAQGRSYGWAFTTASAEYKRRGFTMARTGGEAFRSRTRPLPRCI